MKKGTLSAYIMIAPALILLTIFVIVPAIYALWISLHRWSFYRAPVWSGLQNFSDVLHDKQFWDAVIRGFVFVGITVPAILIIAFLFSQLVVGVNRRLASVLKVSIYLPAMFSTVITSIIFAIMYDYSGGVVNWFLAKFGVKAIAWLGDPKYAMYAIAVPAVWLGMGLTSLIMVAALVDIPREFYEAAELEGANWWQCTRYITLPQMKNVTLYLVVTAFVASLQQFELPLVMTGGGPTDATNLPNLFIFNHFRYDQQAGYAIAAALLMFVVLGAISALAFKFVNSEKSVD